ncbi:MAG: hypothetical protein J6A75_10770 [Lachnospiraceae bacterium]|nr:hypothetical protein [Lachnospiraceae bacterium]
MKYDKTALLNALLEIMENTNEEANLTEAQRRIRCKKAAYALNLCTVSVSQIIDYDDIAVMENEYEAILNNLNLQNMPKDQALLNILNHVLDTITFFRIQEKEKKLVEKRYQNQIKNAIWEAVPSLSVLTDWRDPLNIATTVGLSYMNYRGKKASYELDKEFEDFNLERAAMEQFNNLQRELFDTSWRLADTYNFDDRYRLTERQIKQYNDILIDADPLRRFERLESIQGNFIAYPPYWYYLGHAALEIVCGDKAEKKLSKAYKDKMLANARKSFDMLLNDELYDILREDPVVSACALEYVDILDAKRDKAKIEKLITKAFEMSGNSYDIWQLCALAYLRIEEFSKACSLLKRLVNENYNAELNAQLLSSLYMRLYVYSGAESLLDDYYVLVSRTVGYELFPVPENRTEGDYNECQKDFLLAKKCRLKEKYGSVLLKYMNRYNLEFAKLYNEYAYRSGTEQRVIIDFFNKKVLTLMYELPGMTPNKREDIVNLVAMKLDRYKGKFIFNSKEKKDGRQGENLFLEIMYPAFSRIGEIISVYIDTADNFAEISEIEDKLLSFCNVLHINEYDVQNVQEQDNLGQDFLNEEVFGELSEQRKMQFEKDRNAKQIVVKYADKVIKKGSANTKIYVNDESSRKYFDKYFSNEIFYHGKYQHIKPETVAIIADEKNHKDIIITSYGIYKRYSLVPVLSRLVRFDEIVWGKKGKDEILLGDISGKKYDNTEVEMGELLELFRELKVNAKDYYSQRDERNPFYMLIKQ